MANASDYLSAPRSVDLRRTMVDCQLRTFDVTDPRVLQAVLDTPREPFVDGPPSIVYSDAALAVKGAAETRRLLAPMIIARALQEAQVRPDDRALDIGGASGYAAAVLARLAGKVVAVESDQGLVDRASRAFAELGLANATARSGDLAQGAAGEGPFDIIFVNGGVETRPDALLAQLAEGGRLLMVESGPGARHGAGRMVMFERAGAAIGERALFDAAAVTLPAFARKPAFTF